MSTSHKGVFQKGYDARRSAGRSRTELTASILADLLVEHPDASPSQRVLLATAARLLCLAQLTPSAARSATCATEARSLIRQAERSAKPSKPSSLTRASIAPYLPQREGVG
jgi:hypothetical protein